MTQEPTPEPVKPKSDMWKRRIGALWLKEGKGGKYLSGEISLERWTGKKDDVVRINVLKNHTKAMAKHPDYELFLQREEMARDLLSEPDTGGL